MKKRGQVFTLPSSSFRTRFRKRASLMSREGLAMAVLDVAGGVSADAPFL